MTIDKESIYMEIALEESKKALPKCLPNPPVGCVLVKDGVVVARGYTQPPGNNHAEAEALNNYPGSLDSVQAYITLEPCSFYGRTPSCARLLIERKISEIYIAVKDPDPRNNGKGIKMLITSKVKVTEGVLSGPVNSFLAPYLNMNKGSDLTTI